MPGVAGAYGQVEGYAQFIAHDGKPIPSTIGTLGIGWDTNPQISSLHLIAGNPPTTSDDVVMDAATAKSYGFSVGQRVRILGGGLKSAQTFTITGIAQFGTADNLAGATLAAFTLPTAQRVVGETGLFDFIDVIAKPGADKAAVQRSIAQALPPDAEVVTGQTIINEEQTTVSQALSFFNTALLIFALISLFVGAFTIYNTFSIIVGQRTRELALLRVVGASRGQVLRSVLTEAAIVGFVSSAIGVGLGVAAAIGLEALLERVRHLAAHRAADVRAAHRDRRARRRHARDGRLGDRAGAERRADPAGGGAHRPRGRRRRGRPEPGGGSSPARRSPSSGVLLLGLGLSKPVVALVGVGAVCIFVGVAMLAPAIARPLSGLLGRPLAALLGTPGQLGRENSMRSPRRTAQTASALMVGLALVSAMAVFGASLSESATSSVDQAISADLLISVNGSGQLSDSVPAAVAAVPGVTATNTVYRDQFEFKSTLATLTGVTTQNLADTVIVRMTAGSTAALAQGELLIDSTTATKDHLSVGDTVPVRFAYTGPTTIRIGGIYQSNALIRSYLVSSTYFLAHFRQPHPGAVLVRTNGGPGVETAVTERAGAVRGRAGADPGAVRAGAGVERQPAPRPGLRAAGAGGADRAHRDREHAHAVGARADQGDRPAAGGRDAAAPGPVDDPVGVGHPRDVRRGDRDRHRDPDGAGARLLAAAAGHHRDLRSLGAARGVPRPRGASSGWWRRAGPPGARRGSTSSPPSQRSEPDRWNHGTVRTLAFRFLERSSVRGRRNRMSGDAPRQAGQRGGSISRWPCRTAGSPYVAARGARRQLFRVQRGARQATLLVDSSLCALTAAWMLGMYTLNRRGGGGPGTRRSSSPGCWCSPAVLTVRSGWFGFFIAVCFRLLPRAAALAVAAGRRRRRRA